MSEIVKYHTRHQPAIDAFMREISAEFSEPISRPAGAPSALPANYWVALNNAQAVGTIAIDPLKNNCAMLRRMMLHPAFRGSIPGISAALLHMAIGWCKQNRVHSIYLGTMQQFKAAQAFYEKHGFKQIKRTDLPEDFPLNPLDSIFYRLYINATTL